jgi:outer membrane murein-binding lipoprotein Lpp
MMRRRRGPGLLMTAAVVGTAAHVGASSANKSAQAKANEQAQNQQLAELEAQNAAMSQQMAAQQAPPPVAAPVAAPAAAPAGIDMEQLKQLGELHTAGVLSDEEFAAAKAKVLAGG